MKFTVCYTDTFSAAHAIKSHSGVGRYLHGHDFRTRVCAVSKTLSTENIAIDLRLLESALRR
ncbi:MAG: 6-carboxytetrahydropterin synthase, partial [Sulfolobales archaeon]|nr:6-carboxytetrahydropterin synthase [Sulfolobales archaeon]MDW8010128.1 6-carboxytetrahydropterin synthase [Sulfolobales archaeon]